MPTVKVPVPVFVSPKRELGLLNSGSFSARGAVTPRGGRPSARFGETESQAAGRTGRYAVPAQAPQPSPRLPGLKLHRTVGILDEI